MREKALPGGLSIFVTQSFRVAETERQKNMEKVLYRFLKRVLFRGKTNV
jgi:hypothetical protein